jgi:hypothetical protein
VAVPVAVLNPVSRATGAVVTTQPVASVFAGFAPGGTTNAGNPGNTPITLVGGSSVNSSTQPGLGTGSFATILNGIFNKPAATTTTTASTPADTSLLGVSDASQLADLLYALEGPASSGTLPGQEQLAATPVSDAAGTAVGSSGAPAASGGPSIVLIGLLIGLAIGGWWIFKNRKDLKDAVKKL